MRTANGEIAMAKAKCMMRRKGVWTIVKTIRQRTMLKEEWWRINCKKGIVKKKGRKEWWEKIVKEERRKRNNEEITFKKILWKKNSEK